MIKPVVAKVLIIIFLTLSVILSYLQLSYTIKLEVKILQVFRLVM